MRKSIVVVRNGTHAKVLTLSGACLMALLLLGWGLALDPWVNAMSMGVGGIGFAVRSGDRRPRSRYFIGMRWVLSGFR
ncbi:hypothetical protein DVT68_17370 [Dyella solisilvae]|uniref:Uncharacterized protein n=1 Tax=Dyella solisilvae TaxID=1920168 RepID=A0A370K4G3_9GAMM|nr:hypothetical protein DVT68_17370 [Dyella solisilvae]